MAARKGEDKTDYEAITMADLVALIIEDDIVHGDDYRAEFARRVRPQHWPDGDPVQAILARIRQQEPAGDLARLLTVAEIAADEHAPSVSVRRNVVECCTCQGYHAEDPGDWPCQPYLKILLALDGAQQPVQGELVRGELPAAP